MADLSATLLDIPDRSAAKATPNRTAEMEVSHIRNVTMPSGSEQAKTIVSHEDGKVTFHYRDTRTSRLRKMTLEALEFIRRFLQHVLPTGLMKVRHYGFLNANSATPLERIRELICALYEIIRDLIEPAPKPVPKPLVCPTCNQPLRWLCFIPPGGPSG